MGGSNGEGKGAARELNELIKLLDSDLEYVSHEIDGNVIHIYVVSARKEAVCPYCGQSSGRVHSHYERRFLDLPMQGKKVEIIILNRKLRCDNPGCRHKTFAESFDCLPFKGKRSLRLTDEVVKIALEVSSVKASKMLKKGVADVGKSTICALLKKRRANPRQGDRHEDMHR
jgi:transposase